MPEFTPTEPNACPLHRTQCPCSPVPGQPGPSDDQLLECAQAGHQGAVNELFSRHQKAVYAVACRRLGNAADAQEATQEAFLKAFTHLESFEQRSSFRTWLRTLVRNAAIDIQRRQRRAPRQSRSGAAEENREVFHPRTAPPPVEELPANGPRTVLDEVIDREGPERAAALYRKVKSILEEQGATGRMVRVYELRVQGLFFTEIADQIDSEMIDDHECPGRQTTSMTEDKARNDMRQVRAVLEPHRAQLMHLLW